MPANPEKSSKSGANLHEMDSVYSGQLNNSTSKMQYSISKSPRWKEGHNINQQGPRFYDIPSTISKRSASFGYGNKLDLSKSGNINPPPNIYNLPSDFDKSKTKGIAIGLGRELVKAISAFDEKSFKVPGPGAYEVKEPKSQQKVTISGRVPDHSDRWVRAVPGPGAYKTLELLDKSMKSCNSKYQSPTSGRFSKGEVRNDYEKLILKQNIPCPSKYESSKNYDIIDHYPRHKGQSFSKLERPSIANKTFAPGPGAYRSYSEFH